MEAIVWNEMKKHYKDFWKADDEGNNAEAMLAMTRYWAVKKVAIAVFGDVEGRDIARDAKLSARYECTMEKIERGE